MDKRKLSVSDESDVPRKKANKESETDDSDELGQQIAALKLLDQTPWTKFTQESRKRKVDSDNQLKIDKDERSFGESSRQKTPKVTREEYKNAIGHKDAEKNIKNQFLKRSDNQLKVSKGRTLWKKALKISPKAKRYEYETAGKYIKIQEVKKYYNQLEVDKSGSLWERTLQVNPNVNHEEHKKAVGHQNAERNSKNPVVKKSDSRLEVNKSENLWKKSLKITPKADRKEYEKAGKCRKNPDLKYSDNQVAGDKGENLWERTLQVNPNANCDEYRKAPEHEDADKRIKYPVVKNLQRKMKAPSETLKNIKSKILNALKFKSIEISEKEEKVISKMDQSDEMSEENLSPTELEELEEFKNVMSRVAHFGKTKDLWLSKLKSMSETSTKSNVETLPSETTPHLSASLTQYDGDNTTQTSEKRSSEEVWKHFKECLQSNIKSSDRMDTDDVDKEDMEVSPEYRIHSLEYPKTVEPVAANRDSEKYANTKQSLYRNLNDFATEVMEYSPIKSAAFQVDSPTMTNTRNQPRQRIVYNEEDEDYRKWALDLIKDQEALLKFTILEGRFEDDSEKKREFIDEAEDRQDEIDSMFDKIEERDRWASYQMQTLPRSKDDTKDDDDKHNRENLRNLFQQLYKPSTFEYTCGELLKRIDTRNFVRAFENYFETEDEMQVESDELEETLMTAVDKLDSYLADCRLVRKGKFPLGGNRSLTYYQNFIEVLDTAVDHNLEHLREIIDLAYDIVPNPLYQYLSDSYKKIGRLTSGFLYKKRPDVFSKRWDDNTAFF